MLTDIMHHVGCIHEVRVHSLDLRVYNILFFYIIIYNDANILSCSYYKETD